MRVGLSAGIVVFAIAALLMGIPVPARAATSSPAAASPFSSAPYTVTWNGVDVSTATSPSSAISIDLSNTANLLYSWSLGTATANVSDARLQMFYFGYAVSTRDEVRTAPTTSSSGSIPLNWAPVSVSYLLAGVYRLTASFIAPNGTTLWSENFYVRGTAPLGFVALIPIVLLLILVYEVYALVRSGRYAALGKTVALPPESPPAQTPPSESGAPPESPPENPPPSGGSS